MTVTHLNPASLPANPAFSQGTLLAPGGRLLVVGGQNGVTKDGLIGEDLGAQTRQALRNVLAVLAEAGAAQPDVAKLTIHLVVGQDPAAAFAAAAQVWGRHATAVSVLMVAGLANPAFLVEIDALAQVS
jgi:enamine deaminase RidA (YjgF/YER057c/UK114 family)